MKSMVVGQFLSNSKSIGSTPRDWKKTKLNDINKKEMKKRISSFN
jgi:hypothetical protein